MPPSRESVLEPTRNGHDDDFVLIHSYRQSHPVLLGAVAYCGHVKADPRRPAEVPRNQWVRCVVCAEMSGQWEIRP